MFLRSLLCLFLLLTALPIQAEETQEQRESEFRTHAEAELCPVYEESEDEEDGYEPPICFVREAAVEGDWAGARQAYQNMADSLHLYQLQDKKWVKVVVQPFPDWEDAHNQHPDLPEAVFNKLSQKLFPPEAE